MSTPTMANIATPVADAGKASRHQIVKPPALVTYVPSYFNPVPVAQNLRGGTTGVAYTEAISAQGGTSPYAYAVTGGSLPTGTSLNSSTGVISGTPTVAASFSFTITVTDINGYTGAQAFQITIGSPGSGGGSFTFLS